MDERQRFVLRMLNTKKGPKHLGVDTPPLTASRLNMYGLPRNWAQKLQRYTNAGTVTKDKRQYQGVGYVWQTRTPRQIDRILSYLMDFEEGERYVRENLADAGTERWRKRNL